MSCCGETVKAIANIAAGNVGYWLESQFRLSIGKCAETDTRTRICQACENNTWLTKGEYRAFIMPRITSVIKNIADLSVLPLLPKKDYERRCKLFCRVCKCFIPAKARIESEKCPLGKW